VSAPEQPGFDCGCRGATTCSTREAKADLQRLREHGPDRTTTALLDAILADGVRGATLLDVGGGVGAIQLRLLDEGLASAWSVDASPAYVRLARTEATRRGYRDRTNGRVGDFVQIADEVPAADIVTLDRVVCCYPDPATLVARAAEHARTTVGLVYPRTSWWIRAVSRVANAVLPRFRQQPIYIHSDKVVRDPLRAAGFVDRPVARTLIWQVHLYTRS